MEKLEERYISTTEAAKILGISRVAVFKQIKSGKIKAKKIGRNFVIDKVQLIGNDQPLDEKRKKEIRNTVAHIFDDYGEVIKKLGAE